MISLDFFSCSVYVSIDEDFWHPNLLLLVGNSNVSAASTAANNYAHDHSNTNNNDSQFYRAATITEKENVAANVNAFDAYNMFRIPAGYK